MAPSAPITRPWAWAQITPITMLISDRDRSLDRGVVVIVEDLEVLEFVVEERLRLPLQPQLGVRVGCPAQLLLNLGEVVVVDVAVPAGPDELTGLKAGLLGDHEGQQ